jgi:hypothetical protein
VPVELLRAHSALPPVVFHKQLLVLPLDEIGITSEVVNPPEQGVASTIILYTHEVMMFLA